METLEGAPESAVDSRLGKLAVRRGFISAKQLQHALDEQRHGLERGRKKPRRLGVILASLHYLTDDQLHALLEEQESRIVAQNRRRADDLLLGQILVDGGLATRERVDECLKIQEEAIRDCVDEIPLLGRILVEKGYATPAVIDEALELQQGVSIACSRCGERTLSAVVEGGPCPNCREPLETAETPAPPEREELQRLGKYTILGRLGRGAMGLVYEALDPQLNRKVALKVLRSDLGAERREDSRQVEHFIREAQLAAKLSKHPHIVSVYEADVADGLHYIAMEPIRGQTLGEWRKKGSVSLRQQVKVLRTVASAVHYAHEHGVLHRDLKPGNVLIDEDQRAFVTDFGLAQELESDGGAADAESRKICGTPLYMSPEQARGAGIDRRTDVYSLGVMLYETLEGRPPFREPTRAATLQKVLHEPVPPFSSLGRTRPFSTPDHEIERICLKALAKNPEERYPTAEALAKELAQWGENKGTTADPEREKPGRRSRITLLLGIAAMVVAAILLGIAASRPPSAPRPEFPQAEKLLQSGDYAQAFRLFDEALRTNPGDPGARAGREEARGRLLEGVIGELDRALGELEQARRESEAQAKPRKADTLDEEIRQVNGRRAAAERLRRAEESVRGFREQAQRLLALGGR